MIEIRIRHATCDPIVHVILPFNKPSVRPGCLARNTNPKFPMKAVKLRQPDIVPDNIIAFPNHAGFSRRVTVLSPLGEAKPKVSLKKVARAPSRRLMEDPIAQSRLAELFALKREEKAPENYIRDALEVFHRRNAISGAGLIRGDLS
jgi:hypothetical protein